MTSMSTDRANGLVLTSLTVSAALVLIRDAAAKEVPSPRFMLGTVLTGAGLAVMSQFAPQLAGGFAVLLLISSIFVYGADAWQIITKATSGTGPAKAGTQKGTN